MAKRRRRYNTQQDDSSEAILPANTTVSLEVQSDDVLVYVLYDMYDGEKIIRRNVRTPRTIKIRDIYGFRGRVNASGFLYSESCMLILTSGEELPVRGSFESWRRRHDKLKLQINKRTPIGFKIGANVKPKKSK